MHVCFRAVGDDKRRIFECLLKSKYGGGIERLRGGIHDLRATCLSVLEINERLKPDTIIIVSKMKEVIIIFLIEMFLIRNDNCNWPKISITITSMREIYFDSS